MRKCDIIKAGTRCKVISDSYNNFHPGDIVVALQTNDVPLFCLEKIYRGKGLARYSEEETNPLCCFEVEVLK